MIQAMRNFLQSDTGIVLYMFALVYYTYILFRDLFRMIRNAIRRRKMKNEDFDDDQDIIEIPWKYYTSIASFIVIDVSGSEDEIEKVGEILHLSKFGEYCPERSLRGYTLEELLALPHRYQPNTIWQKGVEIKCYTQKM